MKNYIYITIFMLFFGMFLIESLGLLDHFESAAADESIPETIEHEEMSQLNTVYLQPKDTDKVVTFSEPQLFFMLEETFIEIGQLEPNLEFTIMNEQEDFYELLFGQAKVYVKKQAKCFVIKQA